MHEVKPGRIIFQKRQTINNWKQKINSPNSNSSPNETLSYASERTHEGPDAGNRETEGAAGTETHCAPGREAPCCELPALSDLHTQSDPTKTSAGVLLALKRTGKVKITRTDRRLRNKAGGWRTMPPRLRAPAKRRGQDSTALVRGSRGQWGRTKGSADVF